MTADPEENTGSNVSLITELINSEMKEISDDNVEETEGGEDKTGGGILGLREELKSRGVGSEDGGTKPPSVLPPIDLSEQDNKVHGIILTVFNLSSLFYSLIVTRQPE